MFSKFQLGTVEQMVRMILTWIGTFMLGEGVASGAEYQAAVGGAVAIASFIWWFIRNNTVQKYNGN